MDKNRIKLIFSEKYNQFYKPIRVDEDVGTIYMQIIKNRHDKSYAYVTMYDANITAEQHFIKVMSSNCSVNIKLNELKLFKRNMLAESDSAMQILKELAESECDPQKDNFLNKKKIHNTALDIYTSLNHRKIVQDNRSTYDGQIIPEEVKRIALSKRLFVERSDDYCGNPKHPANTNEKLAIQALYPCGFIVRDRGGIVVAGGKNGFGFKWLLSYCRKLKHKPLPKKE